MSEIKQKELVKVTLASGMGGFIEYYAFFIASFASASIWPKLFFSQVPDVLATALSIASFGVVFLVRPIGAAIFGRVADRTGRRNTLLLTMLLMGVGLLGIALLPSSSSIGVLAIILLFLFRLLFGIGIGGEFGGAVSWISEFSSNTKWRPFWDMWATPVPFGLLFASLSFAALASVYKANFATFGWRIPFFVGTVLVIVGVILRLAVQESPIIKEIIEKKKVDRRPAYDALKLYGRTIALLTFSVAFMITLVSAIEVPYSVSYLEAKGLSSSFIDSATTLSFVFGIITLLAGFTVGSRFGRRTIMIFGAFWALISVVIFFPLINTLDHYLIILADMMLFGPTVFTIASQNALFAESFPTKVRASGSGLSYTFGGVIAGLITSLFIPYVIVAGGGIIKSYIYVESIGVIVVLMSIVSLLFVKETKNKASLD